MHQSQLPKDFVAFDRYVVCSNPMTGIVAPFLLDDEIPLLIGRPSHGSQAPLVWLSAPFFEGKNRLNPSRWDPLIDANKSVVPVVSVFHPEPAQTVAITGVSVLIGCKVQDDHTCLVFAVDFRPLGLAITGTTRGLDFVGNHMVANFMAGASFPFRAGRSTMLEAGTSPTKVQV